MHSGDRCWPMRPRRRSGVVRRVVPAGEHALARIDQVGIGLKLRVAGASVVEEMPDVLRDVVRFVAALHGEVRRLPAEPAVAVPAVAVPAAAAGPVVAAGCLVELLAGHGFEVAALDRGGW